jgi:hypothetical protein
MPNPLVSVILPTYNRAAFLPQALAAIRAQALADWELIIVDDGSTDDTPAVVADLTRAVPQLVRYHRQENRGASGARNAGLDHARGRYVAFYDSDDLWLPHHLADCVAALEAHPEVDWVFGACRRVEHATDRVLLENTFYHPDGTPWPFLKLAARAAGRLRILDDPQALACMIAGGLNCGLQCSVFRASFFNSRRIPPYRVGEDQALVMQALAAGHRLGYFDDVHVRYHVHSDNSSGPTDRATVDRPMQAIMEEARVYEELPGHITLSAAERRARRRRLLGQYFWQIGYALLWQNGRRQEALTMFRRGLRHWPWSLACWKTYLVARARSWLADRPRGAAPVLRPRP